MTERLLVVGGGQAAADLVTGLVDADYHGEITVVGAELHPPYQRPPLSKDYLLGTGSAADLALRTEQYFADHGVRLVLGDPVVGLQRNPNGSGVASCASGTELTYDRLVLATGAEPRRIPQLSGISGVFELRTIGDAGRLGPELVAGRHLVVIGGGFIGLEAAAAGRQRDCAVTVIEAAPQILGRVVSARVAEYVAGRHRATGITIRTDTTVVDWQVREGRIHDVVLSNGTSLSADLVVIGIGARAHTALAESIGLRCADGVLVDAAQLASDGHTLAIGDCAVGPSRAPGSDPATQVRLESVDHATQSAAAAVATLMGSTPPKAAPPWFWSDQGDVKIQVVGLSRPDDLAVTRPDAGAGTLLVAYFRDGVLVSATAVNAAGDSMGLRKALANDVPITPADIAETDVKLSKLVAQRLRSAKNPSPAT